MPAPTDQKGPGMPRKTIQTTTAQPQHASSGVQTVLAVSAMSLAATVVGTALFAPHEQSERAFRLLHWWKRDSESEPSVQRRGQQTQRQRPSDHD